MPSLPARCHKYSCRSRRNLSKRPEQYKVWPKCHIQGCDGEMRIDKYRLNKGAKDHPPVCTDTFCCVYTPSGRWLEYHRISTKGCVGYEDYILERSFKSTTNNSETEECPF